MRLSARDKDATRTPDPGIHRDASGEAADHVGIPRDANCHPIFLILPADLRADYDAGMASCERAWATTGDPLVVAEATTLTHLHRQPIPAWLDAAVFRLASAHRGKEHGKRAQDASMHFARYECVRDAHKAGLSAASKRKPSWDQHYERAAALLSGTFASGEPPAMKASYMKVRADLRAGRGGLYHVIQPQNR
jgi:hypothetical protein